LGRKNKNMRTKLSNVLAYARNFAQRGEQAISALKEKVDNGSVEAVSGKSESVPIIY